MLVNRKLFIDTLKSVDGGLAKREIAEQTTSFIFMNNRVTTYNDLVSVSAPLPIGVNGVVSAKQLYALLRMTTGLDLDVWVEGSELVIKANTGMTARVDMTADVLLPIHEMPAIDDDSWNRLDEGFVAKLAICLQTVSSNMAKPALCTVHWKGIALESTDNYQITRCNSNTSLQDGVEVLLPSSSASKLVRHNPAYYQLADGWIHFKSLDSVIFSCRVTNLPFPNLVGALDAVTCPTPVRFSTRLPEILKKAITLADQDSAGQYRVKVTMADNQLTVSAGEKFRRFVESCEVMCEGDFEFSINPNFFINMLKNDADAAIVQLGGNRALKLERNGVIRLILFNRL